MRGLDYGEHSFDQPWMDTPERRALDRMRHDAELARRITAAAERRAQKHREPCSASPERRAERHAQKVAAQRKKAARKQGRR
jgi:vacuolar-type H+-ATPase subunit H